VPAEPHAVAILRARLAGGDIDERRFESALRRLEAESPQGVPPGRKGEADVALATGRIGEAEYDERLRAAADAAAADAEPPSATSSVAPPLNSSSASDPLVEDEPIDVDYEVVGPGSLPVRPSTDLAPPAPAGSRRPVLFGLAGAAVVIALSAYLGLRPRAVDDRVETVQGEPVRVFVLRNDVRMGDDPDAVVTAAPDRGTATVGGGGAWIDYVAAEDFVGEDRFSYRASGDAFGTATGTVLVAVVPRPNTPPSVVDDEVEVQTGRTATVYPLENDEDPEGDDLALAVETPPQHGEVEVTDGGSVTYTPERGYVGADSFTYSATDADGASAVATVRIAVAPPPLEVVADGPFSVGRNKYWVWSISHSEPARVRVEVTQTRGSRSELRVMRASEHYKWRDKEPFRDFPQFYTTLRRGDTYRQTDVLPAGEYVVVLFYPPNRFDQAPMRADVKITTGG